MSLLSLSEASIQPRKSPKKFSVPLGLASLDLGSFLSLPAQPTASRYLVLGLVKLFSLNLLWSPAKTVRQLSRFPSTVFAFGIPCRLTLKSKRSSSQAITWSNSRSSWDLSALLFYFWARILHDMTCCAVGSISYVDVFPCISDFMN